MVAEQVVSEAGGVAFRLFHKHTQGAALGPLLRLAEELDSTLFEPELLSCPNPSCPWRSWRKKKKGGPPSYNAQSLGEHLSKRVECRAVFLGTCLKRIGYTSAHHRYQDTLMRSGIGFHLPCERLRDGSLYWAPIWALLAFQQKEKSSIEVRLRPLSKSGRRQLNETLWSYRLSTAATIGLLMDQLLMIKASSDVEQAEAGNYPELIRGYLKYATQDHASAFAGNDHLGVRGNAG